MEIKTKLDKYKYENNYSTTEDAFYVDKQPMDTCPILDSIVSGIDSALREIEDLEKEKDYDLYWVKANLENLERYVEDARENTEKIRSWGQQWKNISKRYFEINGEENIDDVL